jgi:hypothetical protein
MFLLLFFLGLGINVFTSIVNICYLSYIVKLF